MGLFDEESMVEWLRSLKGREKEYVKFLLRRIQEKGDVKTFYGSLVTARKIVIMNKAIGVIGYATLQTPREVYESMKGS